MSASRGARPRPIRARKKISTTGTPAAAPTGPRRPTSRPDRAVVVTALARRGEHEDEDEFTAVGLGRHRESEDWLEADVDPDGPIGGGGAGRLVG